MKITHNKVGQNVNITENSKSDRASSTTNAKSPAASSIEALGGGKSSEATRTDLSSRAQDARRIKEIANSVPDVDQAKVDKYRKLIDEGKYKVDSKAVADKMVDEYLEMEN